MNNRFIRLLFLGVFLLTLTGCQALEKEDDALSVISDEINFDWQFTLTDLSIDELNKAKAVSWRQVQLPHDWSIEDLPGTNSPFTKDSDDVYDTGYTLGGTGWYKKTITLPENANPTSAILLFDGVYMDSSVYVNGKLVNKHFYGYTAFWLDIGEYLNWAAENTLLVKVNNPHKNSRWYSGSGIYRTVSLTFKPTTHIATWGTKVTTPIVSAQKAQIHVSTKLTVQSPTQPSSNELTLTNDIFSPDNQLVQSTSQTVTSDNNNPAQELELAQPQLWTPQTPALYRLKQTLTSKGKIIDQTETTFGIRSVALDPKRGFLLNDQVVLLKGMNLHHDHYMLGAAAYKTAEQRRVKRILDAGYNAVRASHNPPSKVFLQAADEQGLLIINEVFDSWNRKKWDHINDYSKRFTNDWKKDLTLFIERDYNHPSVIMWSMGNEIPEQTEALGATTAKMLTDHVKTLDTSRPTTVGANTSGKIADPYFQPFDAAGYNYQEFNYLPDHQRSPNRIMYGSETYSYRAFEYWQYVKEHPFVIGDFVWTGWDYLGEASIGWAGYGAGWKGIGGYPWNLAYCGEIDVLGYKRPAAYYRDVLWQTGKNKLSVFVKSPYPSFAPQPDTSRYLYWVQEDIHPSWNWAGYEGQSVQVVVFSAYPEVELLLNGKSIGKQPVSEQTEYKARFEVPYQSGELTVVGYENGKAVEQNSLYTTTEPKHIKLTAETTEVQADGQSLVYITAELLGGNNRKIYHTEQDLELTFQVSGAGNLIGIGNGNPVSVESFQRNKRKTFNGRLVAVIRSNRNETGVINVTVTAENSGNTITSNTVKVMAD